jgi:hypothetical protein
MQHPAQNGHVADSRCKQGPNVRPTVAASASLPCSGSNCLIAQIPKPVGYASYTGMLLLIVHL